MPTSALFKRLTAVAPLSVAAQQHLTQILLRQTLPKGAVLLAVGDVSNRVFFLEQGLARAFYKKGRKELTAWIVAEDDFMYSVYSYINQRPSHETIELLEDSVLLSATRAELDEFYAQFPEANGFRSALTEQYLLRHDERLRALRMLTTTERHDRFAQDFPDIYRRAPLQHIATYLGMNNATLSRIRARKT